MLTSFVLAVSDTGNGISSEDVPKLFQNLSSKLSPPHHPCSRPLIWGGEIDMLTSEFMESEVRQYHVKDALSQAKVMQMRSIPKECGTFSGSNIIFNFKGYPQETMHYVSDMSSKIRILMLKTVAVEVCVASQVAEGTFYEDVLLSCEGLSLSPELSSIDRLSIGTANYVEKSGDIQRDSIKIGKAFSGSSESLAETLWFFEVCFAVTESLNTTNSSTKIEPKQMKVLFFEDCVCATITSTILQTLNSKVSWDRFGLSIKDVQVTDTGIALIEWEGPAQLESILLVLHRYRSSQTMLQSWSRETQLCKRCIEDALNDLKQQNPHLFCSHSSKELQRYVPDLSCCLSKLISSSSDIEFKDSCAQILGLQSTDYNDIRSSITTRLLQVIEDLDKQPANKKKGHKETGSKTSSPDESNDNLIDEEGDDCDYFAGNSIWQYQ
ncbi:hypothetical protein KP509_13G054500 [Ceratopteris richardii]|nr:hypothetical protein KP509_13G054500 [Ceratopteris richardii]